MNVTFNSIGSPILSRKVHNIYHNKLVISFIFLLLISGCTSPPQKPAESIEPPKGPYLSAKSAISIGENETYNRLSNFSFLVPLTLGSGIGSDLCPWDGIDAGNSTGWKFGFEAILIQNGSYTDFIGFIHIYYSNGKLLKSYRNFDLNPLTEGIQNKIDNLTHNINRTLFLDSYEAYHYAINITKSRTIYQDIRINGMRMDISFNLLGYEIIPVYVIGWTTLHDEKEPPSISIDGRTGQEKPHG